MVAKSYDDGVETLIYEPISYAEHRPNVNPDSPRHFQTKRRRNTAAASLTKQRPKSLIIFRGGNSKKEQTKDFQKMFKRANTVNDNVTVKRANSIDSVLDKSRAKIEISKPITARAKVQEIRKEGKKTKEDKTKSLLRSKSDAGRYNVADLPDEEDSPPVGLQEANIIKSEKVDLLKSRLLLSNYNYLYRGNSHSNDSLKTNSDASLSSSRNSSGFYEYSSAENEYETFSSDNSSVNTDDILFHVEPTANDKDKNAEGISYSRSIKKNRRPTSLSVSRNNGVRTSAEYADDIKFLTSSLTPTSPASPASPASPIDDVFSSKNISDDLKYNDSGVDNTLSIDIVDNTLSIHSAPSPSRTNKFLTKKKKTMERQERPSSLIDIQTVSRDGTEMRRLCYGRNVRIESVL